MSVPVARLSEPTRRRESASSPRMMRRLIREVEALRERRAGRPVEGADLRRLQQVVRYLGNAVDDELATHEEVLLLATAVADMRRGLLILRTGASASGRTLRFKVKARKGFRSSAGRRARAELSRLAEQSLQDRRVRLEPGRRGRLGVVACFPLELDGELLGTLVLEDPQRLALDPVEERLIRGLAPHAGRAVARRVLRNQETIASGRLPALRPDDDRSSELLVRPAVKERRPERPAEAERPKQRRDSTRERPVVAQRSERARASTREGTVVRGWTKATTRAWSDARERSARATTRERPVLVPEPPLPRGDEMPPAEALHPASRPSSNAPPGSITAPYAKAKRDFTRGYLAAALREAEGDLRRASALTGLPPARLIGLLERLDLDLAAARAMAPGTRQDEGWIQL